MTSNPARLLIVEDDHRIASFLKRGLEEERYEVGLARNDGEAIVKALSAPGYALIILDRMLPGRIDGLDVCRSLRQEGCQSYILMLTAKDSLQDKIDGLRIGADDYMTKPFAFGELVARIEALLRRRTVGTVTEMPADMALVLGDLRLDPQTKRAQRKERTIGLTARESDLLAFLMKRAGRVVSRDEILRGVWNPSFDPGTKVVEVYVRYLRQKIDAGEAQTMVETVPGFGYRMRKP
jgi:DNA-binding response OmpR family regulator